MCESCSILCAIFRVGLYSLYRRLCCKGPSPVRPNFAILCIGLENAGKSSAIGLLSGDDLHKIEPTVGFSIKALLFDDCILDIKELGGGEKVRPYWDRYFQLFQGIMFVINSASSEESLQLSKTEMYNALSHHQLKNVPLLVLATFKDAETARSIEELSTFLEVDTKLSNRQWLIRHSSLNDKEGLQAIFQQFNEILIKNLEIEIQQRESSPQHNRL